MKKFVRIIASMLLLSLMVSSLTACTSELEKIREVFSFLYDCKTCYDEGEIVCDDCDGEAYLKCSICDGTGEKDCALCDGTGFKTCFYCLGKGNVYSYSYSTLFPFGSTSLCPICTGAGKVACDTKTICSECSGGKIPCESCDEEGTFDCPDCDK